MINSSKRKHRIFLSLAVLLAAALHLLAGYGIHSVKIFHDSDQLSLVENRKDSLPLEEEKKTLALDEKIKNALLKEAFQKLYSDNYRESASSDMADDALAHLELGLEAAAKMDFTPTALDESLANSTALEEIASVNPLEIIEPLSQFPAEVDLPDNCTQLLHPEENRFAKDIIQATDCLHGTVIDDTIALYTELPSQQIGLSDASCDEGNYLEDRSGIIELGRTDSVAKDETGILPGYLGSDSQEEELVAYAEQTEMSAASADNFLKSGPAAEDSRLADYINEKKASIGHIASSEDFTVTAEYTPVDQGKGYLFKIQLKPKNDIRFRRIQQNIIFLIDRSYSIDKNRFQLTKQAVSEALRDLFPEDNFNIIIFDQHVVKLASYPIPRTPQNIQRAEKFLSEQQHGSLFTATDVASPLSEIIPKIVPENELNTAILLSDGDTTLNPQGQWETIREWTRENNGKVALYCLASGEKNNYPMLDMLSIFNKGSLYVAKSHPQIGATLKELMNDIRMPIGKNIVTTTIPTNESASIHLFPSQEHLPNLYENKVFTLYGRTNSLEDFHLFFQGRYYSKWINIKQRVSLLKSEKGSPQELEQAWAIQNAYDLYKKYLNDGKEVHLQRAKQILQPYNLSVAIGF